MKIYLVTEYIRDGYWGDVYTSIDVYASPQAADTCVGRLGYKPVGESSVSLRLAALEGNKTVEYYRNDNPGACRVIPMEVG